MGDTAQVDPKPQDQPQQQAENTSASVAPAAPVQPATPAPTQQLSVSGGGKEGSPMVTAPTPPQEIAKPTHPEVVVPQELSGVVEKSPDTERPQIDQQAADAGVAAAKESTFLPASATGSIKLPMTYEEALLKKKNAKFQDGVKWFAAYVAYQWKKINPNLEK